MIDLKRMQLPDTPTETSDFAVVMEFLEPEGQLTGAREAGAPQPVRPLPGLEADIAPDRRA